MPNRRIKPDYDERFTVPEPLEYEEAVKRLLGAEADTGEADTAEDEDS